jgi:hypothetical protein
MVRGVRWYLVGSFVLVSLAGCGRGFFQAEREPWRAEAEIACLKSGSVRESLDVVRVEPISGPGACGADFPLKVAAFGESMSMTGFADEDLRPPAPIGNQPRWPVSQPPAAAAYPQSSYPPPPTYQQTYPQPRNYPNNVRQPLYGSTPGAPVSLAAPGIAADEAEINLPEEGTPASRAPYRGSGNYPPPGEPYRAPYSPRPGASESLPRLGPSPGNSLGAVGPVAVKPAATLACPIVSALDRWLASSVQPAALRWFGARVVEIKQISAYSCRGMNGNSNAHISEHAFGNALDIAAFTLADGRRVTVREGWHDLPEEQGFLRDVEAAACQQFSTVLAPGSNAYHYDHIHVDLMRRDSRSVICEPAAVSGEEVAARAAHRYPYASSRDRLVTGSLGARGDAARRQKPQERRNEEAAFEDD